MFPFFMPIEVFETGRKIILVLMKGVDVIFYKKSDYSLWYRKNCLDLPCFLFKVKYYIVL